MGLETERRLGLPGGGDGEVERNEMKRVFSDISSASGNGGEEERKTEAVGSKNQVVGWPLVAAYRRKHNFGRAKMYVKVSMDGIDRLDEQGILVNCYGLFGFCKEIVYLGSRTFWIHENMEEEEEYVMQGLDEMDEVVYRDEGSSDSDVDEIGSTDNETRDTTAAQAREGRDIQGIPWERLSTTRDKYRKSRITHYRNYENVPQSGQASEKECKATVKSGSYYEFRRNSRSVRPTIMHFQLRNLVWATSKHDVYFLSHYSVMHWSSLTCSKSEILNLSGHVAPSEKHPGSMMEGFTKVQVSTLAAKDNLLVVGGFHGQLICKFLDRPGISYCTRTAYDENNITNAVEIYTSSRGALHFIASNNDCGVRDFDVENFKIASHFSFSWPVNHTSLSPCGEILIVVGDDPEGLLVDSRTGQPIATLRGHSDYSFASAWHPSGTTFATGNQDRTCRIWDIRNLSKSVATVRGQLGAVRSIRYTSDGRFMATAESADFVHIYEVDSGYEKEQEIDFFGEISGISFSQDEGETLFVGVWDRTYSSFIEFGRRRQYSYLDSTV
ncbi:Transducin/WD40 repeat-like superfamily protein [Striga hermonthica]|uniref:Transducin/WD40 repeat-like superfamily protein n=1 Tax=Striga hermonthica TaxID=68872 RepID=A0A9N7R7E6_STRHE|nr:Transducin/WD40 repeat-like superfamily protein [Striga hermonthica]